MSRVLRITAPVLASAWILGSASAAEASCVAPRLSVDRASVAPGETIVILGEYFGTTCNDTGQPGPVLGAPQTFITVQLVQGELSVPLVQVDADDDYRFVVRAMVPSSFAKGPASVTAPSVRLSRTVLIAVTEGAVPAPVSAPPTVLVGRDSTAPRVEPPDASGSNTPWIVTGVFGALVIVAIVTAISIRQRRPRSWIQAPESLS